MKRGSLIYQSIFAMAGAIVLAANARATTIVHTTAFSEVIVVETDTFETPGGALLFTTIGVGYSDWLSPNFAADLAGDPTVPSQIQTTASLVALATEYQVLAEQGPNYIVPGGAGAATVDPFADQDIGYDVGYALAAAAGPGYSIIGSPTPSTVGNFSLTTGALEPDGSLLEGTVTFDVFDEGIVEQPVAATPEPSMLAAVGLAMLLLVARRKAAGGKR